MDGEVGSALRRRRKDTWNSLVVRDNLVVRFSSSLGFPKQDGSGWGGVQLERRLAWMKLMESSPRSLGRFTLAALSPTERPLVAVSSV
jgi:hypothetical protein